MPVPAANNAIVAPFVPPAVQTVGVVVVNVTASPDDAVALTVTGDCASVWAVNAVKLMFCATGAGLTVTDCWTCAAVAYTVFPA